MQPYPLIAMSCFLGSCALACDTDPMPKDVSGALAKIVETSKIPGMAAAIYKDGAVTTTGAAGLRALGREEKVTIQDKWHLGSCTKAMTATLAGVLVEQGVVTWETTLEGAFARIDMKPAWKPCTLDMLLHNRGGVPGDLNKDGLWGRLWSTKAGPRDARQDLLRTVLSWEPASAPGTKYEYANGGFTIAGAMLERFADKPWEELVQSQVFTPLGITSAGFGAPGTPGKFDQPCGHVKGKAIGPGPGSDNPAAIGPAGTVHMTISDWARFVGAHAAGESTPGKDDKRILKPETFKKLHTAAPDPKTQYAMGWLVTTRPWAKGVGKGDTGRVLNHNGSNTMWYCVAWVAPERDFAVVVACNQGDGDAAKACDQAAATLIQLDAIK
ncbi:MAG: serine hydrolase domain-containing protein [Planctomycetota bacterium]